LLFSRPGASTPNGLAGFLPFLTRGKLASSLTGCLGAGSAVGAGFGKATPSRPSFSLLWLTSYNALPLTAMIFATRLSLTSLVLYYNTPIYSHSSSCHNDGHPSSPRRPLCFLDCDRPTINFHKSTFVPLHVDAAVANSLASVLGCSLSSFPRLIWGFLSRLLGFWFLTTLPSLLLLTSIFPGGAPGSSLLEVGLFSRMLFLAVWLFTICAPSNCLQLSLKC